MSHWTAEEAGRSAEFIRWLGLLGWNQAECARKLKITAGYMSEIVNRKKAPSETLLHHLVTLAMQHRPDLAKSVSVPGSPAAGSPTEETSSATESDLESAEQLNARCLVALARMEAAMAELRSAMAEQNQRRGAPRTGKPKSLAKHAQELLDYALAGSGLSEGEFLAMLADKYGPRLKALLAGDHPGPSCKGSGA
ncbi:MAG TPA: hypothetical protein VNO52_17165 [Methylomirabilota bacterium]|nr:hypothetical protein [Methylomirabilota bacterium]